MLTTQQLDDVAQRMCATGRFAPQQVKEWMAQIAGDEPRTWTAAATRLIWREQDAGRIKKIEGEWYGSV